MADFLFVCPFGITGFSFLQNNFADVKILPEQPDIREIVAVLEGKKTTSFGGAECQAGFFLHLAQSGCQTVVSGQR